MILVLSGYYFLRLITLHVKFGKLGQRITELHIIFNLMRLLNVTIYFCYESSSL